MKDLLLCVHVAVKTLNLEISRCHLVGYVKELYSSACRTCSTIIFPHSTNHIIVFWRRRRRCRHTCLSSLMSLNVSLTDNDIHTHTKFLHSDWQTACQLIPNSAKT